MFLIFNFNVSHIFFLIVYVFSNVWHVLHNNRKRCTNIKKRPFRIFTVILFLTDSQEIYKTLIIHGAGVKTSLLKLLETGKVETRTTIVGTLQLKDEGMSIHNIIECDEVRQTLGTLVWFWSLFLVVEAAWILAECLFLLQNTSDYFLSARTLYVLPYNADTTEDMTKICLKLLALTIKILGKVSNLKALFLILRRKDIKTYCFEVSWKIEKGRVIKWTRRSTKNDSPW